MNSSSNYGDQICDLLVALKYTHCFYVAGGNIMHLLNSASKKFTCIPVIHEVSAGIAAEYFSECNRDSNSRAFALVTAGPGLTNIITAMAGAFLESRELLVIGGQVKSSDLNPGGLRQNGIQEIDGIKLVESVTTSRLRLDSTIPLNDVQKFLDRPKSERKGPIFLEFCLDAQAHPSIQSSESYEPEKETLLESDFSKFFDVFGTYKRPTLLIGGGVSRQFAKEHSSELKSLPMPIMTTWNASDRIDSRNQNYFGRPNTWGQRAANVILQQSDLIIAIGTRLGLQQTGFNWSEFGPLANIVHVDIDSNELNRKNLNTVFKFKADADEFLREFLRKSKFEQNAEWMAFAQKVKQLLPVSEAVNNNYSGYWNPYEFILNLSQLLVEGDVIIPSSSGGAETVTMQALQQLSQNTIITNKGLASMGYGLAGAIGAALKTNKRVFHIEGDGGFAQNLQELGTVAKNHLPIKTFIFDNGGYASIRMTQKNYFGGDYLGCDSSTGLGLPSWNQIFAAYEIPIRELSPEPGFDESIIDLLNSDGPQAFLVPLHAEQTYFPKISSRVDAEGRMQSNPLHLMAPPLGEEVAKIVFPYLKI